MITFFCFWENSIGIRHHRLSLAIVCIFLVFVLSLTGRGTENIVRVFRDEGIETVFAGADGVFVICQHKAEHDLDYKNERVEVPNDGGLIQQCNAICGSNTAEGLDALL